MAEQNLKNKTVKGVAWSGIDNGVQLGVTFVVGIILARLLTPDDYGLLGIIIIFSSISNALINAGFTTALIRKPDACDEDYDTAFIVNIGLSILFYILIFFSSPFIANFFDRGELNALTRVTSLGIVIGALSLIQQTRLTKRIDFKTQTRITLISSILSGTSGIVMALLGFGVWSLVVQVLSSQIFRTFLLWFFDKWIPKFRFSVKSFHELFGFGWKMMVSAFLDSLWQQMYQVVVGKYYNPTTLGQYTRAKQFSQLFSSNLTSIVQRVTYPVLSNIQDDKERMVHAYRRIIKVTMFVSAISMFTLGAVSEPLLYCLIGSQWHDASVYLPLICVALSTYPLHAINLNMLQVQGRSDLFLMLEIVKKTIAIGPLMIGAMVGIIPMLVANLVTTVINFFLNSHYSGKMLGYSSWMQLKDVANSYIIAIILAISVYYLKYLPFTYWIILPIQIVTGVSVFFVVCFIYRPIELYEFKDLLKPIVEKVIVKKHGL